LPKRPAESGGNEKKGERRSYLDRAGQDERALRGEKESDLPSVNLGKKGTPLSLARTTLSFVRGRGEMRRKEGRSFTERGRKGGKKKSDGLSPRGYRPFLLYPEKFPSSRGRPRRRGGREGKGRILRSVPGGDSST